jgi:membrane-associated phospholipid phosphatase
MLFVLRGGRVFEWEQDLTRTFQAVPYNNVLFQVTSGATNTLSWQFMVAFTLVVALFVLARRRVAAAFVFATFPLHVLAQFPKALVDRPRPSSAFEGIEGVGGAMSFPSGHSEYVVTFYGFLAYLLILRLRPRWARLTVASLWVGMVLATGFGRVAQGRHWPLDVVTSYVVGLGLLSGIVWLYSAIRIGRQRATDSQKVLS